MNKNIVIVAAKRTAVGRFGGLRDENEQITAPT